MAKNPNEVSIWQSLRNMWKVEDIRKKLLYTFLMLLLFRLVGVIPAPGIDYAKLVEGGVNNQQGLLALMNMMTGSNFANMTIMAMGITPYINSSIIMQLLTIAIPALERLQKSGPDGQKKISRITRYVTVILAAIQAIGLVASQSYIKAGWYNYALVGISMAAGTALAMWIGERITEKGIGNGISLLIFAGIISNLFNGFISESATSQLVYDEATSSYTIATSYSYGLLTAVFKEPGQIKNWLILLGVLVLAAFMILAVTYTDMAVRRIPVNYAKRVTGRKMYGGQNSVIPLKVISVGVLPLIFAYSFMAFPSTIISMTGGSNTAFGQWWSNNMNYYSPLYLIISALLIIAFTYFYSSISFQPDEMAKNIQQQGGAIPAVRPGKPTSDYLTRINSRLTMFAAFFLAILATVPNVATAALQVSIPFAASSLLIAVSVILETKRQLDDLLVSRNYDTIA